MKVWLIVVLNIIACTRIFALDAPRFGQIEINGYLLEVRMEVIDNASSKQFKVKCKITNNNENELRYGPANQANGFSITLQDMENKPIPYTKAGRELLFSDFGGGKFEMKDLVKGVPLEQEIDLTKAFQIPSKGIKSLQVYWAVLIRNEEMKRSEVPDLKKMTLKLE